MSRRLKDKVYPDCRIDIKRLVEQTVDEISTINKTVAYLVTIYQGGGRRLMFRVDNRKDLWAQIIQESMVAPTDAEIEHLRARQKPYVPMWKQILESK
jgi:hypothetical protein